MPFYGLAVLCIDDPGVKSIIAQLSRPVLTYGFSKEADYRITEFQQKAGQIEFQVTRPERKRPLKIRLAMPGRTMR